MTGKKETRKEDFHELFGDRRVQLFLGKFLNGELTKVTPVFDPQLGYRYPDVDAFVDSPVDAEAFLLNLEEHGLLTRELCGVLVCCPNCGSFILGRVLPASEVGNKDAGRHAQDTAGLEGEGETSRRPIAEGDSWLCGNCGALFKDDEASFQYVYCYQFSTKGIERISDRLVVGPVREFLHKRGYQTVSPGTLIGESEVRHSFDIVAYSIDSEEGVIVIDFVISDIPAGEDKVIAMFAKVFDTTPRKSILIAFPGLTEKAWKLAEQYKIAVVESRDVSSLFKKLLKVVPPVEEIKLETLDVMTLLSLPDHLRKTAMVICSLGKATAEEIAENTKRARAVESGYLNQLVRMGYLKKERRGREVLFSVAS